MTKHHFLYSLCWLIVLVDAPHLHYDNFPGFVQSLVKHPHGSMKGSDVGHAWVYLEGLRNGAHYVLEGGHSGEIDPAQPRYVDALMDLSDVGDPNPAKALWAARTDGFFQHGDGGHRPNCAMAFSIPEATFNSIIDWIESNGYRYTHYNLQDHHCVTFVIEVLQRANVHFELQKHKVSIPPFVLLNNSRIDLWSDPAYSSLEIYSPDCLELALYRAFGSTKLRRSLKLYHSKRSHTFFCELSRFTNLCSTWPQRAIQYCEMLFLTD